jgi:hypothetical protein
MSRRHKTGPDPGAVFIVAMFVLIALAGIWIGLGR